jgi:hypothetical protein
MTTFLHTMSGSPIRSAPYVSVSADGRDFLNTSNNPAVRLFIDQ